MTEPARTIFLGSGAFAVPIVEMLSSHPAVDLRAVISAPPRIGNRGRAVDSPVADWAAHHAVEQLRPERLRSPEAVAQLISLAPELLVLADYGQIVPEQLLALPRHGALNLHPSLLPRHRGAAPIAAAIMAGDQETGVSLMLMDAGLDSGPLIAQRRVDLTGTETAPQLEATLARLGALLLDESLQAWVASELGARPQDAARATMTRPLRRADGALDAHQSAVQLERQVRAYQPWPGSFVESPVGRVIVLGARPIAGQAMPATLLALPSGGLALATSDGLLELVDVQPAGGRPMSGAELLRGRPALAGAIVKEPGAADSRA